LLKLLWGFSNFEFEVLRNLFSSPSTGEDKGEGGKINSPYLNLPPLQGKECLAVQALCELAASF
jgi:hypothetical protein